MFRITVKEAKFETRSGNSKSTGAPYSIKEQECVVDLPTGERRVIQLQLERDESPLQPGVYEPGEKAGYVGKFGSLEVSTRAKHWHLVKSASAVKAA